ncbi:MAG: T9SS type A sorting domain-containing protein [Bacteroidia bacterium]|nr:T9SS type A sorting domain-containing protein [Bacteroidia bacterium]
MKKIWVSFILLLAFLSCLNAQTNVSGGIYSNTTWTLANSPYILTGSVVIFPGKTLTIEPGVEVRVQGNDPTGGLYLEVRGTLNAVGTPSAPISFISDIPNETYYTWYGISIKGDQGGTVNMNYFTLKNTMYGLMNNVVTYDTLALKGCTFMYNNYGISWNTNVKLDSSFMSYNGVGVGMMIMYGSVTAVNSVFDNNFANMTTIANGMYLYNSSFTNGGNAIIGAFGVIDNCLFDSNEFAIQESGGLTITNTTFTSNGTAIKGITGSKIMNCTFNYNGVALEVADNSEVENNFINENEIGLALAVNTPGQLVSNVKNNEICNNTFFNVENRTNVNLGLEKNCFCNQDSAVIETLIYDGYDDITRGLINYAIYDTTCQVALYYVTKVDLGTTDIPESSVSSLMIYPNPATEILYVADTQGGEILLTLTDIQGKILREHLLAVNEKAEIEVRDLPSGIYFLKENNSGAVYRVIKE